MSKAIVFLADGFEECEGLIVVDILRRAGIDTVTASVMNRLDILSSHKIKISADVLAEDADYDSADIVILPGGMPGTTYLGENRTVLERCLSFSKDRKVAAICAAPTVLASLGILDGRKATCYPSCEKDMNGAILTHDKVTVSGNIITGQALGAAIPFALEIVRQLKGDAASQKVASAICSCAP